jgi:5'(3')-deoxyribonucleotidase
MESQRNKGLIALFDMDGTLADYDTALDRDIRPALAPEDQDSWRVHQDEPRFKYLIKLIRNQPGWWINLDRLLDGFAILFLAKSLGFEIHILTKGPFNHPDSWSEKVTWCRNNVQGADITITEDKSLVYGKLLVDDWPPYVLSWLEFRPRGLVILPDRPWNQGLEHPQIIRYKNNLPEIQVALERLIQQSIGSQE